MSGQQLAFSRMVSRFLSSGTFRVDVEDASRPAPGADGLRTAMDAAGWKSRLFGRILNASHRNDIALFSANARDVLDLGPWIWTAAALCGTPLAVQVAGGGLDQALARLPAWKRSLASRTILRAPLLLLQTRSLCNHFADRLGVRWQPPTRDLFDEPLWVRGACRRFLFLSSLHEERGVVEALQASDQLPPECKLTIAGHEAGFDVSRFDRHTRAEWIGAVTPDAVPQLMRSHDALVFPSWSEADGLPGAVIEATQCGLPVIAAKAGAIDEIVTDGENGLLVHKHSSTDLCRAMTNLAEDSELFVRLAGGARTVGERFRSPRWHDQLEDWLFQVCDQGVLSRTLPFYEREKSAERYTA
jgi:glycosyltransferase involved in cell wall biosynthesis